MRESTSVKMIDIEFFKMNWTTVATAVLKGAVENKSLRKLTLKTPKDSPPPRDVVNEVKQKKRRLVLDIGK